MHHVTPEMVRWLRQQMQAAGAVSPRILVFDRGAYSGPLFNALDRMDIGWITYRKGSEQYPEEDLTGAERLVEYCREEVPLDSYDPKIAPALALRDPQIDQQITAIFNDE